MTLPSIHEVYVCVCAWVSVGLCLPCFRVTWIEVSTYTNTHTCRHTLFLLWKKMQRSVSWFVKINLFSVYLAKKRQLWTNSLIHQLTAPFLYTYKFLLKRCVFFTSHYAFHFYTYRHAQNFLSQRQLPTLHWNKGEWHLICGVKIINNLTDSISTGIYSCLYTLTRHFVAGTLAIRTALIHHGIDSTRCWEHFLDILIHIHMSASDMLL